MDDKKTTTLAHWNLDRWPFAAAPQAADFYTTAGREEALARVEYLVQAGRRVGVLIGAAGAGKSTLVAESARRLRRTGGVVARVDALGVSPQELVWQIAVGLQTAPSTEMESQRLWRLIGDRVAENRLQELSTVLLVDNAGGARADVLSQLVRLSRVDPSSAAKWTMLLVTETGQSSAWNAGLCELVDLRVEVEPWELEDTIGFVQHALLEAGCLSPLFDEAALWALHELSGGLPRQICRLAEFALLAGAAAGANEVDADLLRSAGEEISWPTTAMSVR